jgi:hypothetical protein
MSGGGGKGGQKETVSKTEIPKWIEDPAKRNLRRAEQVQQLAYMPWYGPHVAAFTPTQNAAFQGNIDAAEAFGLLSPNTLTPTTGMPAPTEFAGGVSGYSAIPLYEQALAELEAKDPGTVAQYNALFGNEVAPLNFAAAAGGGGGSRFRGNVGGNPPSQPGSPQPHYLDSGLDDLNNMNFGVDPIQVRNQAKQKANFVSAQNRTPTKHAPVRKGKGFGLI